MAKNYLYRSHGHCCFWHDWHDFLAIIIGIEAYYRGEVFYGILYGHAYMMILKWKFRWQGIGVILMCLSLAVPPQYRAQAKTVDELQQALNSQQKALRDAEQKVKDFQNKIQSKRQEAKTLNDQIGLLDDNIEGLELALNKTQAQINETNAEIQSAQADIETKEAEIAKQKDVLAQYIRSLHDLDQQSTVAIFLKYQTFSEAMSEASTVTELQNRAQETLVTIQKLHEELLKKKQKLEDFKQSLTALKNRQEAQQATLGSQKDSKQHLLNLTNEQAKQYQSLLANAQKTHQQAQAEISRLDQAIREQLEKEGKGNLPSIGTLSWPIAPIFGVSCSFHCSGYPFAYLIGSHTGTDIPTYVGTPIKAPADAYVGRLHDSGGTGYSYILLIHGDNISTVYGHVSGFANVKEGQFITRGTVIGYTGGAPRSHGSGLSTGPHLHFEVRLNDVPVDGQRYLPPIS